MITAELANLKEIERLKKENESFKDNLKNTKKMFENQTKLSTNLKSKLESLNDSLAAKNEDNDNLQK